MRGGFFSVGVAGGKGRARTGGSWAGEAGGGVKEICLGQDSWQQQGGTGDNFGNVSLKAALVGKAAGLQPALHIEAGIFVQLHLGKFRHRFRQNYPVPLCDFVLRSTDWGWTGITGDQGESGAGAAAAAGDKLWFITQDAYKNDFIDAAGHLDLKGACRQELGAGSLAAAA